MERSIYYIIYWERRDGSRILYRVDGCDDMYLLWYDIIKKICRQCTHAPPCRLQYVLYCILDYYIIYKHDVAPWCAFSHQILFLLFFFGFLAGGRVLQGSVDVCRDTIHCLHPWYVNSMCLLWRLADCSSSSSPYLISLFTLYIS